jgi:hypothetical protein
VAFLRSSSSWSQGESQAVLSDVFKVGASVALSLRMFQTSILRSTLNVTGRSPLSCFHRFCWVFSVVRVSPLTAGKKPHGLRSLRC